MALQDCPECRHQVSDQARACPQCGFPLGGDRGTTAQDLPEDAEAAMPRYVAPSPEFQVRRRRLVNNRVFAGVLFWGGLIGGNLLSNVLIQNGETSPLVRNMALYLMSAGIFWFMVTELYHWWRRR